MKPKFIITTVRMMELHVDLPIHASPENDFDEQPGSVRSVVQIELIGSGNFSDYITEDTKQSISRAILLGDIELKGRNQL